MEIQRIDETSWRLPRRGKMRVDGIVYASDDMMQQLRDDQSLEQVVNVAHLPGILKASLAMPDIHWGYGFPIGGVAAMDAEEGVTGEVPSPSEPAGPRGLISDQVERIIEAIEALKDNLAALEEAVEGLR